MAFTTFMACELKQANIPYAINADVQFYDGEEGAWRPAPERLLQAMIAPVQKSPARSRAIMRLNRLFVMRDTRRQRQPAQQNQQPHQGHQ